LPKEMRAKYRSNLKELTRMTPSVFKKKH